MNANESKAKSDADITAYLAQQANKELLRFVTVGSVDDGKSTMIGRLLHDSNGVYEDQLSAVKRASNMAGTEIDFSLFTDGLKAEREQGITIDVAYRYFATEKRKFIIADTPGHVQYTRNMATGASTANVAIILIDARLGVLTQSRRHAYIASLLGIRELVVCVNKMDLVNWDGARFDTIRRDFAAFAKGLSFKGITYIPISALAGDNIVTRSTRSSFYQGATLLEHLEVVPLGNDEEAARPFRFPVQLVLRPSHDYRGFAAQIAAGTVKAGDRVMVLPSKKTTRVAAIDMAGKTLDEAYAPMSVALRLAEEIDVSRGDMIVHEDHLPRVERRFDAMLVWMNERPLDRNKSYLLKHTTQTVRAQIDHVAYAIDLETLDHVPADELALNDIGRVTVQCARPLYIDAYKESRTTGAFILIDSLTNDTVAAGMVLDANANGSDTPGEKARAHVSSRERRERLGHGSAAVLLHASTREQALAAAFVTERVLFDRGCVAKIVDAFIGGEKAGESGEHESPQIAERQATAAAAMCVEAGLIAIVIAASPEAEDALAFRLGDGRVVRHEASAEDPEVDAASIARVLAERGILDR